MVWTWRVLSQGEEARKPELRAWIKDWVLSCCCGSVESVCVCPMNRDTPSLAPTLEVLVQRIWLVVLLRCGVMCGAVSRLVPQCKW